MEKLRGLFTALATPFESGQLDIKSFRKLVEIQLKEGVDGFVVNGTTGESPTLTKDEVKVLYTEAKKIAGDNVPVILGTGSNSTESAIELTRWAEEAGASAALVVVPYYNKPPERGLVGHFTKIAESTRLPVILYNVPGRTIVSLSTSAVRQLSKISNIVGIKEASGDVEQGMLMKEQCGSDFIVTSGDDATCIALRAQGGDGVISVISHVIPREMKRCLESKNHEEYVDKYGGLLDAIYSEPNPIPVKMALHKMGIFSSPELRLPLVTMESSKANKLEHELKRLGLI